MNNKMKLFLGKKFWFDQLDSRLRGNDGAKGTDGANAGSGIV